MEECMVCFEETNNFFIFTCAHKMCYTCLKTFLKHSTKCPVCEHVIITPYITSQEMIPHQVIVPINHQERLRNITINSELEFTKICCFLCFFFGIIYYVIIFVL